MNKILNQAAQMAVEFQNELSELLDTPETNAIFLSVNGALTGVVAKLNHLSGNAPVVQERIDQFPPMTEFMGEALNLPKKVAKEDLSPKEYEKESYISRVDKLEKEFDTIDRDGILNGHTTPDDQLVLRGVAKRANVDGFAERDLDHKYLDDISAGLEANRANAELEQKIQKEQADLKGTQDINNGTATKAPEPIDEGTNIQASVAKTEADLTKTVMASGDNTVATSKQADTGKGGKEISKADLEGKKK